MLVKFLVLCAFATVAYGYSSGAPLSPEICETLTPKHPADPQTGPAPYIVETDSSTVAPGAIVNVNISSTDGTPFKGFIVQGRNADYEKETKPQGQFAVDSTKEEIQSLGCGGQKDSSVTHSSGEEKLQVSVRWVAPQVKGTYVILATIVQSGKVFWVRLPSPQITVV